MRGRRLYVLCLVKGKKDDVCEGSALCFLQGHGQLLAVLCTNHVCQRQELKHNALWEICIAEFVRCLPEGTFFIRRGVKWPKKKMFLEEVFHKKKKEMEKEMLLEVNIQLSFSAAYSDEWVRKRIRHV